MTVEELTQENISLKEQIKVLTDANTNYEKTNKEHEQTIVNLRSKNAELYSKIGSYHEPPKEQKSESEKRNDFWNNYIKEKVNK